MRDLREKREGRDGSVRRDSDVSLEPPFVSPVPLVCLVERNYPNEPNQPDRQSKPNDQTDRACFRSKGAAPSAIHRAFLKVGSMTVAPKGGLGNCVMANARIEFTRRFWML